MTGSATAHDEHDTHADHAIAATIVMLVIVGMFTWIFAQLDGGAFSTPVYVIGAMLAAWGLVSLWVLDRD
jgi:uncharacterized membrane protein